MPPATRMLLRTVYIMGVVLVLLFIAVVAGLIWKSTKKGEPKPEAAAPALLNLGLSAGTDIRSAEADGDRLVINTGREVIVIDLRKNAILMRATANP